MDEEDEDADEDGPLPLIRIDEPLLDAAAVPNPPAPAPRRNNEQRLGEITSALLTSMVGSLFLPALSSSFGDCLNILLPSAGFGRGRWLGTAPGPKGGFLSNKWGRSLAAGCLLVVIKDAVVLYVKWKKAQDFSKKRILDYVRKDGRAR